MKAAPGRLPKIRRGRWDMLSDFLLLSPKAEATILDFRTEFARIVRHKVCRRESLGDRIND